MASGDLKPKAIRVKRRTLVFVLSTSDEPVSLDPRDKGRLIRGHIEEIPLPVGSVDVVISNCVINLSTDKPAVLAEMFRVLRPGGRIGITDVVADDALTSADRAARGSYVGCIAGALSFTEYTAGLHEVGFTDVSLTPTHQAADGMHAAIIRATRPDARVGVAGGKVATVRERRWPVFEVSAALADGVGIQGPFGAPLLSFTLSGKVPWW